MPKKNLKTTFFCTDCGNESAKWMGFCPSCGQNTPLVESPRPPKSARKEPWLQSSLRTPHELSSVSFMENDRIELFSPEMNRVLGGGIVPGTLILIAGEPGIGKSTLLLQVTAALAAEGKRALYVSGEESPHQIKRRAARLGFSGQGIYVFGETDVDLMVAQLDQLQPTIVIIDSIQTLYASDIPSGAGTVAQVKECTLRVMQWAKDRSIPVILAGHTTKDGDLAGPKVLEHMVDVVLHLEGQHPNPYRILRSAKNRFGSTDEFGMFEMGVSGLIEIPDPSKVLLSQRADDAIGSAIVPVLEGSRPVLVEVQALTAPSTLPSPRRISNGIDYNRLLIITAVLTRRAGLNLSNQDVVVNVAGGLKISEPATDLAIALAIGSSAKNIPLHSNMISLGEIGLSGELRSVSQLPRRMNEAIRLGFVRCLIPESSRKDSAEIDGIAPVFASTLAQALRHALPSQRNQFSTALPKS